jgi:hypothetical protein
MWCFSAFHVGSVVMEGKTQVSLSLLSVVCVSTFLASAGHDSLKLLASPAGPILSVVGTSVIAFCAD